VRIGIDYTAALRQGGGIGRHIRSLVQALARLDRQNEYILFAAGRHGPGQTPEVSETSGVSKFLAAHPNFRLKSVPLSDRFFNIIWQRLRLPLAVETFTGPLDIFHAPDFVLPPLRRARGILTVHDLSFMRVPQYAEPALCAYLSRAVPRSVSRADHVLAVSQSTRRDLLELLAAAPDKITVVPNGVGEDFRRVTDREQLAGVQQRYGLPPRFILGLSTLEPRKNFAGLIRAFARLGAGGYGGDLVIAGGRGWLYEPIFAEVERQKLSGRVHFPGFVVNADLPALYTLADLFAFPSFYEGFGLPVLEALACGTPVICADNSSLPEVAGEAALMVGAEETEALAAGMRRLLADEELRQQLAQRGLAQARKFTWQEAARNLLAVYQEQGARGKGQGTPAL
jgi:glycosyltransferase involved in cell wall biosynthesis